MLWDSDSSRLKKHRSTGKVSWQQKQQGPAHSAPCWDLPKRCGGISNNHLSNSLQLAIGKRNRRVQVKYRWRVYCHPQTRDNKAEWYSRIHTTEWIPYSSLYPQSLHNTKLDFYQILMCIECFSGSYCVDVSIFSCLLDPNVTFEHILSLCKQRWCTRVNVSIVFREYIKWE